MGTWPTPEEAAHLEELTLRGFHVQPPPYPDLPPPIEEQVRTVELCAAYYRRDPRAGVLRCVADSLRRLEAIEAGR